MTWKGFWEAIASFCEDVLFIPYDALRKVELDSWLLANIVSWVLLLTAAVAFIYWMLQLTRYHESSESHYTFDENP